MFGTISKYLLKPLVPVIRLSGDIDVKSTYLVRRSLRKISPKRSKALGLIIDTNTGSPAQCEIIVSNIKTYCKTHKIPFYTFAENQAISMGYWMLCAGDKVYADKASAIGGVGTNLTHLDVKDLVKSYNIELRTFSSDIKKVIPSIYQDVEDVHRTAMQSWADNVRENFIKHIEKQRGSKLSIPVEGRDEKLYQGQMLTGQEGKKYELIDDLGTYVSVFHEKFPNTRIVDMSQQPTVDVYKDWMREVIKVLSSKVLPYFVLYYVLKNIVRVYLILLAFGRKKRLPKDGKPENDKVSQTQGQPPEGNLPPAVNIQKA